MTELAFNATEVKPATGTPDPVPSGYYYAAITASEMKETKNKDGSFLHITLDILDGQYKGQKVFDNLNLRNQSQIAQEIAYGTLSAICHATQILNITDSQQLHNIPMIVKVKLLVATAAYDASNDVRLYGAVNDPTLLSKMSTGSAPTPAVPPAQPMAPPAVAPAPPAQPWQQPAPAPAPAPPAPPAPAPPAPPAPAPPAQPWQQPAPAAPAPAAQPWQQPAPAAPAPAPAPAQHHLHLQHLHSHGSNLHLHLHLHQQRHQQRLRHGPTNQYSRQP